MSQGEVNAHAHSKIKAHTKYSSTYITYTHTACVEHVHLNTNELKYANVHIQMYVFIDPFAHIEILYYTSATN